MHLRQRCARWFEIVVPRPLLARAVERIAATGAAELDTESREAPGLDLSAAETVLDEFRQLQRSYEAYWPEPRARPAQSDVQLETTLTRALGRLRAWEADARPHIRRLETMAGERAELLELRGLLAALGASRDLDFGELVDTSSAAARVFVLPPQWPIPRAARAVLRLRVDTEDRTYLLAVGPGDQMTALEEQLQAAGGRTLQLPDWLEGNAADALAATDEHIAGLDDAAVRARQSIEQLGQEHDLADALGQIRRVQWMIEQLPAVQVSEYLARITGWTDVTDAGELIHPLDEADIPAVIGFPDPPADREPPRLTHNPVWARPFELFMRLLGTPGQYEPDPSRLLAFIAPILFGYMFGDVGQGIVLIVVGLLLRRRWPVLALLIPGGAMACVFGLVFGSVFTLEGLIHPLWVNPLEHPLPVLIVPFFGGAGLLLLGLLLNALAASRRRHIATWLRTDAGLVVIYAGGLAAFGWPQAGLVAVACGVIWYLAGCAWEWRSGGIALVAGHMAELLEHLLQLAVNTLSFLRVGAFALAHSGLSVAVMTLAESAPGLVVQVLVLVIGNAMILVLEGLVVAVQTTRLILFEFFIRFFRAEGRPFRPVVPPSAGSARGH